MKWLRAKIKQCTSLALLALTINLALSFGHIHLEGFRGGEATAGTLLSALSHHVDRNGKHDSHSDDLCPICMAQAALGTGLTAAAPVLSVNLAYVALNPNFGSEHKVPERPRAGFRSRGPPLS